MTYNTHKKGKVGDICGETHHEAELIWSIEHEPPYLSLLAYSSENVLINLRVHENPL